MACPSAEKKRVEDSSIFLASR